MRFLVGACANWQELVSSQRQQESPTCMQWRTKLYGDTALCEGAHPQGPDSPLQVGRQLCSALTYLLLLLLFLVWALFSRYLLSQGSRLGNYKVGNALEGQFCLWGHCLRCHPSYSLHDLFCRTEVFKKFFGSIYIKNVKCLGTNRTKNMCVCPTKKSFSPQVHDNILLYFLLKALLFCFHN